MGWFFSDYRVSPNFCCVGVGLWLLWGWAVTKFGQTLKASLKKSVTAKSTFCSAQLNDGIECKTIIYVFAI